MDDFLTVKAKPDVTSARRTDSNAVIEPVENAHPHRLVSSGWLSKVGTFFHQHRQLITGLFVVAVLGLLVMQARKIHWAQVWEAVTQIPAQALMGGIALAVLSYLTYSSYELIGKRYVKHQIHPLRVLAIAWSCYSFNMNFGSLAGGVALRWRLYRQAGLDLPRIVKLWALNTVTNWSGYLFLAGAALISGLVHFPKAWHLSFSPSFLRVLGATLLLTGMAYLIACFVLKKRPLHWKNHEFHMPSAGMALTQVVFSSINWMLMAGVVFTLFQGQISYPVILTSLLMSSIAGVITHIPGGLGVLEAVFISMLAPRLAQEQILGVVLAYRGIYYLGGLGLGLMSYAALESLASTEPEPPSDQKPDPSSV